MKRSERHVSPAALVAALLVVILMVAMGISTASAQDEEPGITDVHSSAQGRSMDGSYYYEW